jgi:UDPglucose--hexose-1-phosphate uridylyltransferase
VPDLRLDPLSGTPVVVVASRQDRPNQPGLGERPHDGSIDGPDPGCPFCPGGLEAPEPYAVRAFPNRWPALPGGTCEVILYSPDHDLDWAGLSADQAGAVVDLWAQRSAALGARPEVAYVLVFENRGAEVGATIAHPHGQIYAYDQVPPLPRTELDHGDVEAGLGPDAPGDRLVARVGSWRSWVPAAAGWPFELVLAPDEPVADLPSLDATGRQALADLLGDAVARLERALGAPVPYMWWLHQRPFDGGHWPRAWLHLHLCPWWRSPGVARHVAAAELGGGVLFNPVDPAAAALTLRRA